MKKFFVAREFHTYLGCRLVFLLLLLVFILLFRVIFSSGCL